jgi:hypothetical protein
MTPYPQWLHILSWAYLSLSFACALLILLDEIRRPQKMMVMNFVWPITALYFGPLAVWGYFRSGLKTTKRHMQQMRAKVKDEIEAENRASGTGEVGQSQRRSTASEKPSREQVAVGVSHCGAGCTLGDIGAEWWVFLMGLTFAGGDFQTRILLDFLLAWGFGVAFQYLTIAPMRGLSPGKGLAQAIRADTLSIVSFQAGLFGWMALTYYAIFARPHLHPNEAVFWFMMQIGMIIGFFTCYPANRFLLRIGWKERMPQYELEMKRTMRQQQSRPHAA